MAVVIPTDQIKDSTLYVVRSHKSS